MYDIRSKVWSDLAREFNQFHEVPNLNVKPDKLMKKWQNWKSYNKLKALPHPFKQCEDRLDYDVIRAKLRKVRERVATDPEMASILVSSIQEAPAAENLGLPVIHAPVR